MSADDQVVLQAGPAPRRGLGSWTAFGLCAGILVAVAIGVSVAGRNARLEKAPVALHRLLSQMDKSQLGPYQVVDASILPEEIVEALGTKEYIQWRLEDTRRPKGDALRYGSLFVTYYTGGLGTQVPHTPERCFLGANWATRKTWDTTFEIPNPLDAGKNLKVPSRVLVFTKAGLVDVQERTVVYTFYANGGFACSSNEIRWRLNLPWVAKTFFSKVEVNFAGSELGLTNSEPEQAAKAACELLQTVLPVLVRDHWPREEELKKDVVSASR
jgi:hypothetical protein